VKGARKPKLLKAERVTFLVIFLILQFFQELSCPLSVIIGVGDGYGFGTNHPHRRGAAVVVIVLIVLRTVTCLSAGFGGLLTEDFLRTSMLSE
jgi:hypothetical protein